MKRIVLLLFSLVLCECTCFGALGDADDGYLTEGEYDYDVWLGNYDELYVMGGGADRITAEDYGYIEVRFTSTPISNSSGIWDIILTDYTKLLYLGGETDIVTVYDNATSILKGGLINHIRSFQYADNEHIDLYCQPDWSWLYESDEIAGITGLWESGAPFTIDFIDKTYLGYDPVWMNINVIEIPEPATVLLITLGAVLARKKR